MGPNYVQRIRSSAVVSRRLPEVAGSLTRIELRHKFVLEADRCFGQTGEFLCRLFSCVLMPI